MPQQSESKTTIAVVGESLINVLFSCVCQVVGRGRKAEVAIAKTEKKGWGDSSPLQPRTDRAADASLNRPSAWQVSRRLAPSRATSSSADTQA